MPPDTCPEHAQLAQDIALIQQSQEVNNKMTEKILDAIEGKNGLITRGELNKEAITRAWWWLSGVSLAILGLAGFALRKIF